MTSVVPVITVDGPSGVGKGTVTRALVRRLRWHRLDSGALYRLLALAAVEQGIPLDQSEAVAALAKDLEIRFDEQGDAECIYLKGRDVTREVREESTGGLASRIATAPEVRAALVARQQAFRQFPGLVADGRDMGTVIFSDAPLKLFIDASPEARAQRRLAQLRAQGSTAILADLCSEIAERDRRDRDRAVAPLKPAEDAVVIDTTRLTPDEVMAEVDALLNARRLR